MIHIFQFNSSPLKRDTGPMTVRELPTVRELAPTAPVSRPKLKPQPPKRTKANPKWALVMGIGD